MPLNKFIIGEIDDKRQLMIKWPSSLFTNAIQGYLSSDSTQLFLDEADLHPVASGLNEPTFPGTRQFTRQFIIFC